MSVKAMVFIDGGWLYRNRATLFARLGEDNFEIDYARLPRVICEDVANYIDEDVSIVRTCYYGTIPSPRSGFNTSKQSSFYEFLEKSCGYETEIHEVDVGSDGQRDDCWIKMALSANMLFYAAQPAAYDLLILVGDDTDYTTALRRVRLMGKRVQIVVAHQPDGKQPLLGQSLIWKSRVSDLPHIYLDDHAGEVKLVRERIMRVCKQCGREEETTWAGPEFFCSACRGKHRN